MDSIQNCYAAKERGIDPNMMRQLEKMIMLQEVDNLWKDHLLGMDHTQLTYRHAGRDYRLTDVHGRVVRELIDS